MRKLLAWCLTLIVLAMAGTADAATTETDAQAIRRVIEAQLAAFEHDDAPGAFAYATPSIQQQFGSAEVFLGMVQQAYPVVYRPRTVRFLPLQRIEGRPVQMVEMSDRSGMVWIAIYRLQRQPDGSWLIDGCALVPGRDAAADAGGEAARSAAAS